MFQMEHFWREKPFSEYEDTLLDELFEAHYRSSFRENPSTMTAIQAAAGSGCLEKAIAAAILTLGNKHGPLEATAVFLSLDNPAFSAQSMTGRIPGWGGTFQKDGPDPHWKIVDQLLKPEIKAKIDSVTAYFLELGKNLYPNPSAYTAAVAITIGLPAPLTPYLFIAARLPAWTQMAARVL
jgi:citrate synthase